MLMRRIVDAFAEYEWMLIKTRTKAALAVTRSRGERISREAPYGYRLAADSVHLKRASMMGERGGCSPR